MIFIKRFPMEFIHIPIILTTTEILFLLNRGIHQERMHIDNFS